MQRLYHYLPSEGDKVTVTFYSHDDGTISLGTEIPKETKISRELLLVMVDNHNAGIQAKADLRALLEPFPFRCPGCGHQPTSVATGTYDEHLTGQAVYERKIRHHEGCKWKAIRDRHAVA